jgi:peptidoglycan/LPS O-acetylase OafA/YrhL
MRNSNGPRPGRGKRSMTSTGIEKKNYMPGLDGLRALAVFTVIAFHMGLPFAPGGFLGVTLFFVLSGYLITDILLSEWNKDERIHFKSFFIRRGKRLLPSVLFLLFCLAAFVTIFRPDLLGNLKSAFLPAMFFFSNWWYIFQKIPYFEQIAAPSLLNHFWSLAVEVQFYLVWPSLLLLVQRFIHKKWMKVAAVAALAVLSAVLMSLLYQPGEDPGRIYYGTDTRVFSLLLGALMAFVFPSAKIADRMQKKTARIVFDVIGFITLLGVLFMTYFITQYDDFLYYGGMFLFSAASAVLIAAASSPLTVIGRVFSFRPLRFIGKISYGVYLWQFPIIVISNSMFQSNTVNVWLSLAQVAATILLATLSYYLVENPIRKAKIIEAFRKSSVRGFFANCLRANWRNKTATVLVTAFVVITIVGFTQALPASASGDSELGAPPSEIFAPPDDSSSPTASPPAIPSPSPSVIPSADASASAPASASALPSVSPSASPDTSALPSSGASPGASASPQGTAPVTADPSPGASDAAPAASSELDVTLIGDSVGIDVAPYLKEYYPKLHLYAEVGRQFYQAKSIVKQLLKDNKLGSMVVIELGSNGSFTEAQMRALIEQIGSDRQIVFVNSQVPRSWCAGVNSTLEKISAEYSNTVIADWYTTSIDKKDYFYKDGVHPNATGSPVLAKLIADAIAFMQDQDT